MKTLFYLKKLVSFDSVSSKSNREVSLYIENKLKKHGFQTERLIYRAPNRERKYNIIAKKGEGVGGLAYSCHSDVVPADQWHTKVKGPFEPAIARERLYGRGSCDMKGSIACMLQAAQTFDASEFSEPLYFICTADEECGYTGAKHVVENSKLYREIVENKTPMIIGEPTLLEVVHAHKGSFLLEIISKGISAHSSTREGHNANLAMIPLLNEARNIYDELETNPDLQNEDFDPPTMSWNIGINDYTQAINMTPAQSRCTVYFRPMPGIDHEPIVQRLEKVAQENGLELKRNFYGQPVFTDPNSDFVKTALELSRNRASRTVSYGTDGGAFVEVEHKIIFGPGSIAQAHTHNEWISLEQLSLGTQMFAKFINRFCCKE